MHPRLFRLIELHSRIDDALRSRHRTPTEASRLFRLKVRARRLANRLMLRTARI